MLQHRGLDLDLQLLSDVLTHPVHRLAAARTGFLVLGKVMFDALTRQIRRQGPAAALGGLGLVTLRQPRVRHDRIVVLGLFFRRGLFGFVEDAVPDLFAARGVTMRALKPQLLLKLANPLHELVILGPQRRDLGHVGQDQSFHILQRPREFHRDLESNSQSRVKGGDHQPMLR
jgi:hypothetical protein